MNTMLDSGGATQGLDEIDEFEKKSLSKKPVGWGALIPLSANFPAINLINEKTQIGRSAEIVLGTNVPLFSSISKIHFEIHKTDDCALLVDKSANGTFANDEKVGRNKEVLIRSNTVISLCKVENTAYVFNDFRAIEEVPPQVAEKYIITKKIGSGAYGEVKLAFRKTNKEQVAVKIIPKKKISKLTSTTQAIQSEMKIMKRLSHPCIVHFEETIETPDNVYLILEFVKGGELFQRVEKKQFEEWEAKILFLQMVYALRYLHDNNIVHRDLKPENILMASDKNVTLIKVTDFGLSKFLDGQTMLTTMCGTPNYLAPEVIRESGLTPYSNAVDVWALGVILFICLVGYPPFSEDREDYSMKQQILEGLVEYPDCFWFDISEEAKDLVQKMICVDVSKRITLTDILEHDWIKCDIATKTVVDRLMAGESCTDITDKPSMSGDEDSLLMSPPTKKKRAN